MKNGTKRISAALLCGTLLCGGWTQTAFAGAKDMRAVWIATVYSSDYPSALNDAEAQKQEFIDKLDKIKAMGMNAVAVQVRPKGDAFYESGLNPWSEVLTGTQGQYPGYDTMAFMIEETHKRGMEFHAWMNPYRITTSGTDLTELSADNMARKHPDWILSYNGAMYYNPAKEEVKQYICDSVEEIVKNYDVDAIHFDDYFYPSNYPLPEGEGRDGAEASVRLGHVNDLVRRVHETVHDTKSAVQFGISPMGIWKNDTSDPTGSATKGTEGYYSVFGDAKTWVENGWVDYIVPQIYWEQGNQYADYETLVKWWSDVVRGSGVKLYIGQGIYKDVVAKEIADELAVNEKYDVSGSFFFSLRDLLGNRQGCSDALKTYYAGADTNSTQNNAAEQPARPVEIERKRAYAARAKVTVNGKNVDFEVYTIDDYTYFKLRDIAGAVNGTEKQFDTVWNEETASIDLIRGTAYAAPGTSGVGAYGDAAAVTSTAKLFCDGQQRNVSAFTINDYTYFKLRDIAKLLDMGVTWDEGTATIGLDTSVGYEQ